MRHGSRVDVCVCGMTINGVMVAFNIFFVVLCVAVFVVVGFFYLRSIPFHFQCVAAFGVFDFVWMDGQAYKRNEMCIRRARLQYGWYILRVLSFGRCWFAIGVAATVSISTLSNSSILSLALSLTLTLILILLGWCNDAYGLIYWDYWFVFVRSYTYARTHAHNMLGRHLDAHSLVLPTNNFVLLTQRWLYCRCNACTEFL